MIQDFGQNFKKIRKAKGLKQHQLAQKLGVRVETISRYESGMSYPPILFLEEIFDVLETDLLGLFGLSCER